MRYFLCFVCPPLAVLSTGRIIGTFVSGALTLFYWVPGVIHALLCVRDFNQQHQTKKIIRVMREPTYLVDAYEGDLPRKVRKSLPRRRQPQLPRFQEDDFYDPRIDHDQDPAVGMGGTRHKRR